jgi:hypothetical protein
MTGTDRRREAASGRSVGVSMARLPWLNPAPASCLERIPTANGPGMRSACSDERPLDLCRVVHAGGERRGFCGARAQRLPQ